MQTEQLKQLIEEYRYINVDFLDWYESVESNFKEKMEKIGIHVKSIYFELYSPHGCNGACFEGYVRNWKKFLTHLGYTDKALITHASNNFHFVSYHKNTNYYHEHSVKYNTDLPLPEFVEDENFAETYSPYEIDDVRTRVMMVVLSQYDPDDLYERFVDFFTDCMYELYNNLKEEFDYLTSDEAVLETLKINGIVKE